MWIKYTLSSYPTLNPSPHTYIHIHTYIHTTYIHTYKTIYTHTYMNAYIHIYIQNTYLYTYTEIYTSCIYTHTYICIYIQIYMSLGRVGTYHGPSQRSRVRQVPSWGLPCPFLDLREGLSKIPGRSLTFPVPSRRIGASCKHDVSQLLYLLYR